MNMREHLIMMENIRKGKAPDGKVLTKTIRKRNESSDKRQN